MNKWDTLEENLRKILKVKLDGVKNLEESLEMIVQEMRAYLLNTDKSDRPIFFKEDSVISNVIDKYNEKFASILKLYNKGNTFETYKELCNLIKDGFDHFLVKLKPSQVLYRMRSSEEYVNLDRKDLFHNPFDKLETISKQRYSIDGFPCLYLGSSLYGCWMETRRPDIWKANFAAFKNQIEMFFFNVDFPSKTEQEIDFLQIILCCLCSIKVNNNEKKHKFEYIFPELLLHSIISIMGDKERVYSHKISGIKYLSSFYKDSSDSYQNKSILYNYVIPVQEVNAKIRFCPVLKDIFKVSEVNALYKYKLQSFSFVQNQIRINAYYKSLFFQIEKDLNKFDFIRD